MKISKKNTIFGNCYFLSTKIFILNENKLEKIQLRQFFFSMIHLTDGFG